jgi:hypothetical protein
MSTGEAMDGASNECGAARVSGACEALALAMLVYGLAQCGEAFAADLSADVVKDLQPMVGGKPMPEAFAPSTSSEFGAGTTDFRLLDEHRPSTSLGASAPSTSLPLTSPWQHLADYRSQGRVQLLTLWQSPRNMVSLQSGKHGGPSLQWSSRVMNHGGATRGVLDRFVASSLGAARLHPKLGARNADAASLTPAVK